jgi:hypothetical protein
VAPVPPTPPPPPPAGHPQVKGDRCAGLLSALGSATSALRRLEASKHSAPSYAKKLKKAKQRLTAATKAAAHC